AVVLPVRQAVDAILIRILQQKIVIEHPRACPHHHPPVVSRIPRQTELRSKIPVWLVYLLAEQLMRGARRDGVRNQAELIENEAAAWARRKVRDLAVGQGRTRHRRQVAVRAPSVPNIVHAKADVQVRKQVERVAQIALDARVEVPARRAAEGRVLAEVSEAVE